MPNDVEPLGTQPDDPTQGALFAELKLARQFGLNDPSRPLPDLLYVARIVSTELDDADRIEDATTKAIARIGGMEAEALMILMGFTDGARHLGVEQRRKQAMTPGGHESYEAFRSKTEPSLLRSVATQLSVLVSEQRMVDHLAKTDPKSGGSPTPSAEPQSQVETEQPVDAAESPLHIEPPIEAIQSEAPSAPTSSHATKQRIVTGSGALLATIGIVVLIVTLGTRPSHGASVGSCGSTTAQLFASSSAETPSDIYVYAPHQEGAREGWSNPSLDYFDETTKRKEVFRLGEVRLLAISYVNTSGSTEQNIIARVAVPQGGTLIPNSACLYKHGNYSSGKRYDVSPLFSQAGLKIGSVASSESVYLTFQERLPTTPSDPYDVRLYGRIGPEANLVEPEWTREQPYVEPELTP